MTPNEYKQMRFGLESIISMAKGSIRVARENAEGCPLPPDLVPATSEDINVGAILWYPDLVNDEENIALWTIVEEVLRPNDPWKAYLYDGCRYGLDGAYVEADIKRPVWPLIDGVAP